MKPNFKLLSAFVAVAENASFRKAADQIHLSLPAVSMQIKQLEEGLGVTLFQRTTRRVELTHEGEQLMISARKAMAELDGAFLKMQQVADLRRGHLSLACVPTIAGTRLPSPLTQFARQYPSISIHVRELSQPALLEAVGRCEVEFGIGPRSEDTGELEFCPVFEDHYMALFSAQHPSAEKSQITMRELSRMPMLTLGSSQFHEQLLQTLKEAGLEPELNYEFTHVGTLIAMVDAGLGVGILPATAVPRRRSLKALRVVHPAMSRTISIITRRGHVMSPSALRFVEMFESLSASAWNIESLPPD